MNTQIHDLEYQFQMQILMAFKTAAVLGDKNFFKQRNIDEKTIKYLEELPMNEIAKIAKLSPFSIEMPKSLFNSQLSSGINREKDRNLTITAIKLGASRECLTHFVQINSKQYQQIRKEHNIDGHRTKPPKINDTLVEQISKTHNNLKKQEIRLNKTFSALEILIKLAEAHDIEINQLYTYYYCENADLFNQERLSR